jgi:predicted HAD superfamily Cof-like phosphohydrolase
MSMFHDQAAFLEAGDVTFPSKDREDRELAEKLVVEEFREWADEPLYGSSEDIKEALDLMYVTAQYINTLIGPDKALECWNALQENNMSKCIDGKLIKREDGKILKPEGYKKLDLTELLYAN